MVSATAVYATNSQESALVVSIDAKQLPLRDVLNQASRQTGWTILVDERLVGRHVSGSFEKIALESFLRRSLRGEALIVLYDQGAKSISIRSFGAPKAMVAITPNPDPASEKRLQALMLEEQRSYEAYFSNPNSIEPLTGMKLGEIAARQAADKKAYEEYISNPSSTEPLTGMKLTDIAALQEKEKKEYEQYLSDPNAVEPLSGMKLSEIVALRDKEQKEAKEEFIIPESSLENAQQTAKLGQ